MKTYALLSWYDEQPDHLRRCVRSLAGFADVLVSLDGSYATWPGGEARSDWTQGAAIINAAASAEVRLVYPMVERQWASEVEKRATMFELARQAGATPEDWFLIIDGDMELASYTPEARKLLAASTRDIAEVRWHDVMVNGMPSSTLRFRSLFRALPGLTVERTHYLYTVDCPKCGGRGTVVKNGPHDDEYDSHFPCSDCHETSRRFLWHEPSGHPSDEPTLDLYGHVTLHHYNSGRGGERKRQALAYYAHRDANTLESAGDWR